MLIRRIISSILVIVTIALVLSVDWLTGLLATFFIVLGLYEFYRMLENKGISAYKYVGIGVGAVIPLLLVFRFELTKKWELFFIITIILFLFLMQFRRRQNHGAVEGISTTIFGILYISWTLSYLIRIRYLDQGLGLLVALLLMTKLGDIGAYFIGSRFGKHPLVPHISPKKSVEGSIGGLIFSVLGGLACKPFFDLAYIHLAFIGFILGVLGQLGDLSES
ncbi:MAG: phosphatidate cytidylyltransferase, partial [Candidatus Omnitrophota bacterium]